MSAIASFYVVPVERLTDIVAAATPVPGGWFRPARDNFWDVLRGSGRALEAFGWSGWAFNTLDLYLDSRHHFMSDKYGDAAASAALSKARGSFWQVLPAAAAAELLARLDPIELEPGDLTAFIAEEHGPAEAAEGAEATRAALRTLKSWLSEIPAGAAGLLSIG
jgi:hypothetical protein